MIEDDPEKARLLAYLQNIQIEELEEYLRRGRSLRVKPTAELQELWVADMEAWSHSACARCSRSFPCSRCVIRSRSGRHSQRSLQPCFICCCQAPRSRPNAPSS